MLGQSMGQSNWAQDVASLGDARPISRPRETTVTTLAPATTLTSTARAGDKIIKNGDQKEFFYFVEKGCVEEFLPDGKLRFTHGAGDYFGEEAFLNKTN